METMSDADARYEDDSAQDGGARDGDLKRTLLAGVLGAVVGSVGYFIYTKLEEDQKHALRQSIGKFVEDKIADVRSQFKL